MVDDRSATAPCPAWVAKLSDVTLRRLVIGGCALFWVCLAVAVFA
ncbi:hypothetical protein U879_17065 [Defluviimonas sp. 20V17]|nr:hypothetical protein U879_17065 [Defluviimonas sp. 20V17]SDX03087.1 hypothetical protein SAMN05444006_10936 [Allgaiera indica]